MNTNNLQRIFSFINNTDNTLLDYINCGNYPDANRCLKFIALVKWHNGFFCRNENCAYHNQIVDDYIHVNPENLRLLHYYKKASPYERICIKCKTSESPTAHTRLHSLKYISTLFTFANIIIGQKHSGRLTDIQIGELMNKAALLKSGGNLKKDSKSFLLKERDVRYNNYDSVLHFYQEQISECNEKIKLLGALLTKRKIENARLSSNTLIYKIAIERQLPLLETQNEYEHFLRKEIDELKDVVSFYNEQLVEVGNWIQQPVSLSRIEEYRYMLQQYLGDWKFGKVSTDVPWGIAMISIKNGQIIKTIYIARQLCRNGLVTAMIYGQKGISELEHFIKTNLPKTAHIIFYGFDESYKNHFGNNSRIEFDVEYHDFNMVNFKVQDVSSKLQQWFSLTAQKKKANHNSTDDIIVKTKFKIEDDVRLQLHINECISLNYYDVIDTGTLIVLIILFPSLNLKRTKKDSGNDPILKLRNQISE